MAPLAERIRDIQLPPEPPFWPPAPGWWLLLFLVLTVGGLFLLYRYRKRAMRRTALAEVGRLQCRHQMDGDLGAMALGLSSLLRRLAMVRDSRSQVAGLHGEAWLSYLDRSGGTKAFSQGEGRVLATLPYGGSEQVDVFALVGLVRDWVRRNA